MKKSFKVKCPHCKEEFSYYESESRPFCSERCQSVDMGKWLSEDFKIAGEPAYIEDQEDESEYQ